MPFVVADSKFTACVTPAVIASLIVGAISITAAVISADPVLPAAP